MNPVDAAPNSPVLALGTLACAALVCLLLVSAAVLAIVAYRRSRRGGSPPA